MATEVQNGTAVLYGITNGGSAITISGYASFILDSTKAGHKFKLDAIEDEVGFDKALIATNANIELDITWTPSAISTTNTRANAAGTAVFLSPLSKVTLANFKVAAFNADWIYIGDESIDLSHGAAKMSLKIRKYDDAAQNTSLTTTVSG